MGSFLRERHCRRRPPPRIGAGKARELTPWEAITAGLRDGVVIFAVRQFWLRTDLSEE